jgi:hypothetical protein
MLTAKTTALIAAMSVLGTVAPAAFAQDGGDYSVNIAEIEGVEQSNTNDFEIEQSQVATATATVQEILDALGL